MPLAQVNVVSNYIEPVETGTCFKNDARPLPAFENAPLSVLPWIKGDSPIRSHGILTEKLVLNIPPGPSDYRCRCRCHRLILHVDQSDSHPARATLMVEILEDQSPGINVRSGSKAAGRPGSSTPPLDRLIKGSLAILTIAFPELLLLLQFLSNRRVTFQLQQISRSAG